MKPGMLLFLSVLFVAGCMSTAPPVCDEFQLRGVMFPIDTIDHYQLVFRFQSHPSGTISDSAVNIMSGNVQAYYIAKDSFLPRTEEMREIWIESLSFGHDKNWQESGVTMTLPRVTYERVGASRIFRGPMAQIENIPVAGSSDTLKFRCRVVLRKPGSGKISSTRTFEHALIPLRDGQITDWTTGETYSELRDSWPYFSYRVSETSPVLMVIFNIYGQPVDTLVNETRKPGHYGGKWDASGLETGLYFYKLTVGDSTITRKLYLTR